MIALPDADVLAAFTAAAFVLIVTPGADMTLFVGQTLAGGRRRGLVSMLGTMTGLFLHAMLASVGLSALLAASAAAFAAVKIAGAGYLVWLAVATLRHGSALSPDAGGGPQPLRRVYLTGLGVNLLNPKIILFFVTFLPQFVAADDPAAGQKLMLLGFYFIALALPACTAIILAAERFVGALRRSPRIMRGIDWLFAGMMSAFAVRLLLARSD